MLKVARRLHARDVGRNLCFFRYTRTSISSTAWKSGKFTVFYDGSCPLCRKEIAHYEGLESDVRFSNLFDSDSKTLLEKYNIQFDDALERMHVVTEQEEIVRNAEAFREIWRRMPYWKYAVPFLENKFSMRLANYMYDFWVAKRGRSSLCR